MKAREKANSWHPFLLLVCWKHKKPYYILYSSSFITFHTFSQAMILAIKQTSIETAQGSMCLPGQQCITFMFVYWSCGMPNCFLSLCELVQWEGGAISVY